MEAASVGSRGEGVAVLRWIRRGVMVGVCAVIGTLTRECQTSPRHASCSATISVTIREGLTRTIAWHRENPLPASEA